MYSLSFRPSGEISGLNWEIPPLVRMKKGGAIMEYTETYFGKYKNLTIREYTLDDGNNLIVKILSLGGTIREINYKGKNRVLGFNNAHDYINSRTYFGAIVGRVAGRVSNGTIRVDGVDYKLNQNEGTTCLHGGQEGFSFKVWEFEESKISDNSVSVTLKYISPDLESGFPGEVTVFVRYTVYDDDSLSIEYFAKTNKTTPITLTNHSYFNLNDDLNEDILEHFLKMDADSYLKLDKKGIPVRAVSVENTPFDFRSAKMIKSDMDLSFEDFKYTQGYDHPFILNGEKCIELYSKKSGISLSVETTEPVVVLYCSNKLEKDLLLSNGEKTFNYQGVCLETQWHPDALNQDFLPDNILEPEEKYYSKTIYRFKQISD